MESSQLICIYCNTLLDEQVCLACNEYKGVMTFESIQETYPDLAKELTRGETAWDDEAKYFAWLDIGFENKWITPPFCMTHDGDPYLTKDEEQDWEDGGDPCAFVVKLALENGYYEENTNG